MPNDPLTVAQSQGGAAAVMFAPRRWLTPSALSDDTDLPYTAIAIRSTAAGSVDVICWAGNTHTLNFTAGETRTGMFTRILSTGASGITASNLECAYLE